MGMKKPTYLKQNSNGWDVSPKMCDRDGYDKNHLLETKFQ